ncbi:MAG: DUF3298 and DUF4163 domain-containing protein [Rikenellaceae bacterium]|nr:DUF3298 and DUF4163 domain-containing protein [Rikenellaceae bacterium]
MKKTRLGLLLLIAGLYCTFSCRETEPESVQWEQYRLPDSLFARSDDEIEISYPVAHGPFAEQINGQIRQSILTFLGVSEETVAAAVDSLLSFRNNHIPFGRIPYTLIVNGEPSRFGHTESVILNLYQYLGGAHGIGHVSCLTFDTRTGKVRNPLSLFDDPDSLLCLNRLFFVETVPLQADQLFMPVEELPLPENMLLDSAGLHMFYDPYEIAPYASGPTEYMIPLENIRDILRNRIL